MLRVIQLNTLEDRSVHDKAEWDQAVKFFESSVKEKLVQTEETLAEMMGPSTTRKWLSWKYATDDQNKRNHVKSELDKILHSDKVCSNTLHSLQIAIKYFWFIETRTYFELRRTNYCSQKPTTVQCRGRN